MSTPETREIHWKDWSKDTFNHAQDEDKLVLLDLTATWCHWCHVMDDTTYSDADVVKLVNDNFVPVRVDIDRRPDVSERYNRGGFPTTAFLSSRGESIWGATYIPPADMKRVIRSILKAKGSGEIDRALVDARAPSVQTTQVATSRGLPSNLELKSIFEGIFSSYDPLHGGFGREPKFPNPDALDMLIDELRSGEDKGLSQAVRHTLIETANGLYDPVEGGVFRYSVTRDWSVPHYEKMLETNLGLLRNLARAHVAMGEPRFVDLADGIVGYLVENLMDSQEGGFFGSQDADENYYKLPAERRSLASRPSIDMTKYSGWNALASWVLMESGALLGRRNWINMGRSTLDFILKSHWDPDRNLVRHTDGQRLFLFEDQAEILRALLLAEEVGGGPSRLPMALNLVDGVRRWFSHPLGGYGDIIREESGIGELAFTRRSLITNSKWAQSLALLGIAADRPDMIDHARTVIGAFDQETIEMHGAFASSYYMASKGLRTGPLKVDIHATDGVSPDENPLWTASKRSLMQNAFTSYVKDSQDFAVVCSSSGCSEKITDPVQLELTLRVRDAGQV